MKPLQVEDTYRNIWQIAWPIMVGSLANTIINITDTAFVSRIGETELAASAIGGVFYFVLVMLGIAIGIGAQIMIARKAGENKTAEIGSIFDNSLVLLLALGSFMMLVVYTVMPHFIYMIISSSAVAASAVVYLEARSYGLLFMMMLVATRCLFTGIGQTRIIGYTTGLMMMLNFLLGYSLTFGHFGFPALGIKGAGLASALSEGAASVYAVVYTLLKKRLRQFMLFRFRTIGMAVQRHIIALSAPILLQHLLSMGSWFLFFVLIEKIGQHALAISNIVRSIYMVLMTPIWGYSQAANSMVSNIIGQNRPGSVLPLTVKLMKMSSVTSLITVVFLVIAPDLLLGLVTADSNLAADSKTTLYIASAATLFFSVSMILLSAISGTGDTKAAMLIEIVNITMYLLFVIVCTQVLLTTVEWVWVAEIQYWILMGVISYFYLRSGKWKKQTVRAE